MPASDLNLLAFDTVTDMCSVALSVGGHVVQLQEAGARHSRLALGMAEEILRAAGLEWRDLHALAVDVGPGAFTGARLGIGLAQGLAYGANLPVIPVNSLEALAESARGDGDVGDGDALILPAIDARMAQVYFGLYAAVEIAPPALAAPAEVGRVLAHALTADSITGVGSGWDQYAPALQESLAKAARTSAPRKSSKLALKWLPERHPEAATIARLAATRGLAHAVNPLHLRARYLRTAVAKPPA